MPEKRTAEIPNTSWMPLDGDIGIRYPRHIQFDGLHERLPVDVEFDVCEDNNRLVIDRLVITRRTGRIDATTLQELPLMHLLSLGLARVVGVAGGLHLWRHKPGGRSGGRFLPVKLQELTKDDRAVVLYRFAYAVGHPPTAAVAASMGLSPAAAAKRIERLRAAGRLGATERGRMGV